MGARSPFQELESLGYRTHTWSNDPDFVYGIHNHPYDKMIVVLEGSIRFDMPQQQKSVQMRPGDRLELPAGTAHGAVVGPAGVTCLEGQKNANR
jgi:quercetin dioxygenase-like cupin family protein